MCIRSTRSMSPPTRQMFSFPHPAAVGSSCHPTLLFEETGLWKVFGFLPHVFSTCVQLGFGGDASACRDGSKLMRHIATENESHQEWHVRIIEFVVLSPRFSFFPCSFHVLIFWFPFFFTSLLFASLLFPLSLSPCSFPLSWRV